MQLLEYGTILIWLHFVVHLQPSLLCLESTKVNDKAFIAEPSTNRRILPIVNYISSETSLNKSFGIY